MGLGDLTRRQAVGSFGVAAAGAALFAGGARRDQLRANPFGGHGAPEGASEDLAAAAAKPKVWNFVSRPDLHPPVISVTTNGPSDSKRDGFIFMGPHGLPSTQGLGRQPGALIMDRTGEVVWYLSPAGLLTDNLAVQSYRGQPVLTWFEGVPTIVGNQLTVAGTFTVADASYRKIATISSVGSGWAADGHECVLTPQGTALIAARRVTTANLTAIGGTAKSKVLDNSIQEIDVATGKLVFEWSGLKNIPVTETHVPFDKGGPTDPYHFNSVDLAPDGDLIISARHTWTVYKVSRQTGAIVWRLGGKKSGFTLGPGVRFAWQHDVKSWGHRGFTMFDNEAYTEFIDTHISHVRSHSRAIFLDVNERTRHVTLSRRYLYPRTLLVPDQGSVQPLADGRVLVGWGSAPFFSELSRDGDVLLNGVMPVYSTPPSEVIQSYRTLTFPWAGHPADPPAAAVRAGASGGAVVYASWNGATEVARWHVLAGPSASSRSSAGSAARAGFETAVTVTSAGPFFAAAALDANGHELARSAPVKLG